MKCFTAGTQIVVGVEFDTDGVFVQYVTVNIEDIQVGDLVYSYDTATGEVSLREVTDTFVRSSDHINYLTILDEQGHEQVIETTDGHPFWVVTDEPDLDRAAREVVLENGTLIYHENIDSGLCGFWVEAKDLKPGDIFLGVNGELSVLVVSSRVEFDENIAVYNLRIDGNHNYFIIAKGNEYGQACILVHNGNGFYTVEFENGMKYHGKGDYERALESAKIKAKEYGTDRIIGPIDWKSAPDTPSSFIGEARRIAEDGGLGKGIERNYNMINSPGKILIETGTP